MRPTLEFALVFSFSLTPLCRWVQDYHLMILPSLLKAAVPKMKVGFFLHTPFPSSGEATCVGTPLCLAPWWLSPRTH